MNAYLWTWAVLAVVVLILASYRMVIGHHEDHILHLLTSAGALAGQQRLSHRIAVVDFWGQLLTVLVVVYGLTLLGVYVYHGWLNSYRIW